MSILAFTVPGWSQLVAFITSLLQSLYDATDSAGLAIIIFTILAKTVLLPLTLPALRSSRRQQELAPMIREINKKHGKDRAAASAETMALYRQYGFNPAAGCLPALVQIPFFFALWRAINNLTSTPMGQDNFLWLEHIAQPDRLFILPMAAAVAQFIQTRMAMQNRDKVVDAQQKQMNMIMQFMPFLFLPFGATVPAGAVLYWVVSSVYSAVVQFFITGWGSLTDLFPFLPRKHVKSLLPAPRPADAPPAKPGFFGRFQERMIEMQQQQQEAQKQRNGQAQSPAAAPTKPQYQVAVDEISSADTRHTQDAWQLPGAPGTTGRTVFATGAAAGGGLPNGQADRAAQQARQRQNGNRGANNRKKRK